MAAGGGYEGRTTTLARDIVMVLLAVVSILFIFAQQFDWFGPGRDREILYLDLAIVGIFWVEYLDRLRRAPDKRAFVASNWYELPGMVPIFPGMEGWAGVRFFRLLRLLRILRLVGALRRFEGFERLARRLVRENKLGYVALLAAVLVLSCATLVWLAEPERFPTFGDSLWWAIVTATTVGYGDFVPATTLGRLAGVVLMLLGIGLIGTMAATLSSLLVERRLEPKAAPHGSEASLPVPGLNIAVELERLARLHDAGKLSAQEFEKAKRRLLG